MLRPAPAPAAALALTVAAVAAAAVAGPAQAAPARSGTAAVGAPYTWTGAQISGVGTDPAAVCAIPGACDDTLVTVAAGDVKIAIGEASAGGVDLDLYVYASDASGKVGDLVASDADGDAEETATFLSPAGGPYLVRVVAATALQATYKGTATVTANAAAAATGGTVVASAGPNAPGQPAPPAQTVVLRDPDPTVKGGSGGGAGAGGGSTTINRAPKAKIARTSARVLSGSAADSDGTVAKVQVSLVRLGSGSAACTQLVSLAPSFTTLGTCTKPTKLLTATGRINWSLRLRRALPKGRYVLYVKATDRKGLRQATATKRSFTVR